MNEELYVLGDTHQHSVCQLFCEGEPFTAMLIAHGTHGCSQEFVRAGGHS